MKRAPALWTLLLLIAARSASAGGPPYFDLVALGPGVWAAISSPDSDAGSNAGFVVGSDGVLVIDTFQDPRAAQALLGAIREKTTLPIRYVVNTHYHLDHVAGNGVFREAGAVILAQHNVRGWETTENLKFFGAGITDEQKREVASYVPADIDYRDGVEIHLGDRKIVVRVFAGHTGGDSVVVVPDAQVVFTGDLFWNHALPNLIDAKTQLQIATNRQFVADYPSARFVPGHGPVAGADDVRAFVDYLVRLRALVSAGKAGHAASPSDLLPEWKRQYGTWTFFDYFALPNLQDASAELAGRKRTPTPSP